MIELSPAGRAGTPDEVATVAALLMGPDGAFITGSDFLDGRRRHRLLLLRRTRPTLTGETTWSTDPISPPTKAGRMVHRRRVDRPITEGHAALQLNVGAVHFTPGARTAWHSHDGGQTLYVTEGRGLVQSRGGRPSSSAGDVIYAPGGKSTGTAPPRALHDPPLHHRRPGPMGRPCHRRRLPTTHLQLIPRCRRHPQAGTQNDSLRERTKPRRLGPTRPGGPAGTRPTGRRVSARSRPFRVRGAGDWDEHSGCPFRPRLFRIANGLVLRSPDRRGPRQGVAAGGLVVLAPPGWRSIGQVGYADKDGGIFSDAERSRPPHGRRLGS